MSASLRFVLSPPLSNMIRLLPVRQAGAALPVIRCGLPPVPTVNPEGPTGPCGQDGRGPRASRRPLALPPSLTLHLQRLGPSWRSRNLTAAPTCCMGAKPWGVRPIHRPPHPEEPRSLAVGAEQRVSGCCKRCVRLLHHRGQEQGLWSPPPGRAFPLSLPALRPGAVTVLAHQFPLL